MPPVKANPDFNKLKTRTTGSFKRKRNKSKNSWKPFLFFSASVGLATEGILDMNQAEIRKVQASIIKATRIPNRLTITPPRAAPKASITDQVEPLSAFAVTRCSLGTSEGIMALLAGSKNPDKEISITTKA